MSIYQVFYGQILLMILQARSYCIYCLGWTYGLPLRLISPHPFKLEPMLVSNYREELFLSLLSARQLAVETIQEAQRKHKAYYDCKTKADRFWLGEWILIKFPHEESGKQQSFLGLGMALTESCN